VQLEGLFRLLLMLRFEVEFRNRRLLNQAY
jgi:hypothetical protein